ncbi:MULTISPECIES: thioredoxin domain-containing protein [Streptomyces]|uniref:Thioredoxin domain-containing protein n=1 Tax=Streptomyces morookaense TaxID=1970 RepID=A0A7Y7B6G9_STRMO|nr:MULTISPECIES: thioredoxin domain-containing protein [Streptomyces]MCC2279357.1 DsbA family protein [Streptomyces sp. ET3-23]NVK79765.1 thioredoxin domain-containing protein [Streptomyces morookaense]GHF31678.1 DSBA oxidoreductase [Streptomyces morookaense]
MSTRNNAQNKQAARERLRAQRERDAKRAKTKRQLIVGGAIVAVLAAAGGIGWVVTNATNGSKNNKVSSEDWQAAADRTTFTQPANTTGDKGTEVVIGNKDAKNTLDVFEDMRCPMCSDFEQGAGDTVVKDIKNGKYKARYHIGTFLDRNPQIKGSGSKNALSALGAALNIGPDAFLHYKEALFSAKNHPEETDDAFSDNAKLIDIAQQVKELKGNAQFEKNVKDGTYDKWALAMSDAFDKLVGPNKDIQGTPGFKLNGKVLSVGGAHITPEQYNALVDQQLKK